MREGFYRKPQARNLLVFAKINIVCPASVCKNKHTFVCLPFDLLQNWAGPGNTLHWTGCGRKFDLIQDQPGFRRFSPEKCRFWILAGFFLMAKSVTRCWTKRSQTATTLPWNPMLVIWNKVFLDANKAMKNVAFSEKWKILPIPKKGIRAFSALTRTFT